jgi:hypothetical protein
MQTIKCFNFYLLLFSRSIPSDALHDLLPLTRRFCV